MTYNVIMLIEAEYDLEDIYQYISESDSPQNAKHVIRQIKKVVGSLGEMPFRGNTPMECRDYEFLHFREVFFKPYRIFYKVTETEVIVYMIVDGRRNVSQILKRYLTEE